MKSNSGREKAPKAVMMFKGIKGLVGSGAGMTKTPVIKKIRPEDAVHIDAGNLKPASSKAGKAAGSPKDLSMGSGDSGAMAKIRPEGATKRDSAGVVKPN